MALEAWGGYRRPAAFARRNASSTEGLCRCSRPKPPATPPHTQGLQTLFPCSLDHHLALSASHHLAANARGILSRFPPSISSLSPHFPLQWVCGTCLKFVNPNKLVKRWTMSTKTEKSRTEDASLTASKYLLPSGMKNTTFGDGFRVQGSGFRVQGFGSRVWGLGSGVQGR